MGVGAVVTSANWVALVLVLKSQVVNCCSCHAVGGSHKWTKTGKLLTRAENGKNDDQWHHHSSTTRSVFLLQSECPKTAATFHFQNSAFSQLVKMFARDPEVSNFY
jgi:hypothetical protein